MLNGSAAEKIVASIKLEHARSVALRHIAIALAKIESVKDAMQIADNLTYGKNDALPCHKDDKLRGRALKAGMFAFPVRILSVTKNTYTRRAGAVRFARLVLVIAITLSVTASKIHATLTPNELEQARKIFETSANVYLGVNDLLKIASEIDSTTKLPFADQLKFLVFTSKLESYFRKRDYGGILIESGSFVGMKVLSSVYPFAVRFVKLGALYVDLFVKLGNVNAFFRDQFVQRQIDEYFARRKEGESADRIRTDPANADIDGFLMPRNQRWGTMVLSLNQLNRLKEIGMTPENWFSFLENVWILQHQSNSMLKDPSVIDLAMRLKMAVTTGLLEQLTRTASSRKPIATLISIETITVYDLPAAPDGDGKPFIYSSCPVTGDRPVSITAIVRPQEKLDIIDILEECRDYYGPPILVRTQKGLSGYVLLEHGGISRDRVKPLTEEGTFKIISLESVKCEGSLACTLDAYIRPYEVFIKNNAGSKYVPNAYDLLSKRYLELSGIFKTMALDPKFRSEHAEPHSKWSAAALLKEAEKYAKLSTKFKRPADQKSY